MDTECLSEKRRCTRLRVAAPVIVAGKDSLGRKFREETRTLSINRLGAAIETAHVIAPGADLLIKNQFMGVTVRARALRWTRGEEAGLSQLAVELLDLKNVWGIQYPPADWRPCALEMGTAHRRDFLRPMVEIDLSEIGPCALPEDGTEIAALLKSSKEFSGRLEILVRDPNCAASDAIGLPACEMIEAFARRLSDSAQRFRNQETGQPDIRL